MNQTERTRQKKDPPSLRTIRETVMGLIIITCSLAMLFRDKLNLDLSFLPEGTVVPFAIAILMYGVWRVFRGVKSYREGYDHTEE